MSGPARDHTTAITTPLAPSVEKAYYRKCIELKRRLNEVEAANDELKVKRLCLDRGIMKMRLERAFLLDELRKRMEHNGDGSEGSGEDGMTTPPPDRPHRDKRKRLDQSIQRTQRLSSGQNNHTAAFAAPPAAQQLPSQSEHEASNDQARSEAATISPYPFAQPPAHQDTQARRQTPLFYPPDIRNAPPPNSSPYESARPSSQPHTDGLNPPTSYDRDISVNRTSGATGEALSAGPTMHEDANGERRIQPGSAAELSRDVGQPLQSNGDGPDVM